MGERRKRKSLWDMEDESKNLAGISQYNSGTGKENHSSYDSDHYNEFSAPGTFSSPKSRDHSGWGSRESLGANTVALMVDDFNRNRQDIAGAKEIDRGNSYYKNISPGFDGGRHKHNRALENDCSGSGRYPGRGRSRSRSRRDRSRSRRDRGRSRSRSRSRSRTNDSARDQTRSRTPSHGHRRESYGWSDGRSRHEKLSQTCRDFVAGGCRRGSQCRFLHPDNISRSDWDYNEDDRAETWRNRSEHDHMSGHSIDRGPGSQSRNDVSDYGEDEQLRNQSRSAVHCRNFLKGNCRWGDGCRFSHHVASGDNGGKGTINASFVKDIEHQSDKNWKPPCKYFAAGNCHRDNCRFSHEGPKLNILESRPGEDTSNCGLDDNSKLWNGPTWDDTLNVLNTVNPSGWSETVANTNITGETAIGRAENRWAHSSENESRTWGILEQKDDSLKREKQISSPWGSGNYGGGTGTAEYMVKERMVDKQEYIFHDSPLQNQDGISHVHGQNRMQEGQSIAVKALHQNAYADLRIQHHHQRPVEDDINLFGPDPLAEINDSRNAKHPVLFPGSIFNQNGETMIPGHSSLSIETDRSQDPVCPNPLNGRNIDLNGPEQHMVSPVRLQSQMQDDQNAVKTPEMLELVAPQFVSSVVSKEQAAQVTKLPVGTSGEQIVPIIDSSALMAQRFVNEELQPQIFVGLDTSNSTGRVLSSADAALLASLVNTINVQSNPVTRSLDLFNPIENDKGSEYDNQNLPSGSLSHSTEQKNQMPMERSSPLSTVDPVFGNSTAMHHENSKAKEQEKNADSEINGGNETAADESKGGQQNKQSENVDGRGKVDEDSAVKDDKAMRVFKNALIEFVKEILKPTWKEGRMSREVHKTIVKKVVDKVISTIQGEHIPKTQTKVEQYLSYSKPKITKLVQAYMERCLKTES